MPCRSAADVWLTTTAGWARLQGRRNAGPVQRRRIECGEVLVGDDPRRDSHETSGIAGMPDLGESVTPSAKALRRKITSSLMATSCPTPQW